VGYAEREVKSVMVLYCHGAWRLDWVRQAVEDPLRGSAEASAWQ